MEDGLEKRTERNQYLVEHFTRAYILRGKISYLEEIKEYIVKTYVKKGLLRLIKPTYSRNPIAVRCKSQCVKTKLPGESNGEFFGAFVLRGEVKYCEQVKAYINTYVEQGLVLMEMTPYSKEKQFIEA